MSRGILTAANSDFWPILRHHVRSCREQGFDVTVVNHGLIPRQIAAIASIGGKVIEHPREAKFSLSPRQIREKQDLGNRYELAWYKPLLLQASPFDETLWIDADAIPLRGISNLFDLLKDGPFISNDWWCRPWRDMYGTAVRQILGSLPDAFFASTWVNSGVFGVRRSDPVICNWIENCHKIMNDDVALAGSPCRDQTALAVTLSKNPELMRVISDWRINMPVNGLIDHQSSQRKNYNFFGPHVMDRLRNDHPHAWVIHWLGPKPWKRS